MVDEAAIYNRALSSQEIQAIYNAGSAGKCKPPTPPPGVVLYTEDFEGAIGPEWSNTSTNTTPVGNRRFLGQFGNQTVTLNLSNLPPHTNLTIAFDLFILRTWDGNNGGPDVWEVGILGGPVLLHTTFQLVSSLRTQAYPENHPGGIYPGQTGALELDTLGYSSDAVYYHTFTVPHSNDVLRLQFRGAGLQALTDESWGLDNVMVVADGPTVALTGPTNGAAFSTPTNLVLTADAAPVSGAIHSVQFISDHILLGTVTNTPYSLVWTNVPAGLHVVTARASDDSGRTAESSVVVRVNGLLGEYFQNTQFTNAPVIRLDPTIAFDWVGQPPVQGVPGTSFSARWTGEIQPAFDELYTFYVSGNDGFRLWVDGTRVADDGWLGGTTHTRQGTILLVPNRRYLIQLDYYQATGSSDLKLEWSSPSQARQVIPASQLFPPEQGVNRPPNTPVIDTPPADGWAVDWTADMSMSADMFNDPDTGQSQEAAEWQILTVSPSNIVWFSATTNPVFLLTNALTNGVFTNSHTGLTRLLYGTDYRLRLRHKDNSGTGNAWGGWSERLFNTRPPGVSVQPLDYGAYTGSNSPAGTLDLAVMQFQPGVIVGGNFCLTVGGTNISSGATYQWFFKGTAITDATNASLSVTNAQAAQAGTYSVELRNAAGTVVSLPATLTVQTGYTALVQSTFDTSIEGWTVFERRTGPAIGFRYAATGGNPGGCAEGNETTPNGGTWHFKAPAKFSGNLSGLYGGYIEYQVRQPIKDVRWAWPDVELGGSGIQLGCFAGYPGSNWTTFRLPLNSTNFWLKLPAIDKWPGTVVHPTEAELLRVLSSVTNFMIRGEYNDDAPHVYLDNVRLLAPDRVGATILVQHIQSSGLMTLEWPTNAVDFHLESTESLTSGTWITNVTTLYEILTNGLITVTVDSSTGTKFFRLSTP